MARGDLKYVRGPRTIVRFQTKGGQTAIKAGEPVIQDTSGDVEYVMVPGASVTTSDTFVGVAISEDTVTSTADGYVDVCIPSAGTIFGGYAKTKASLASTQKLTKVVIDYTSPNYTIDESTTTNGLCVITEYDTVSGEIEFAIDMTESFNT